MNRQPHADDVLDRARVADTVAAFALALDARNVDAAVGLLADRVSWDYESVTGRPAAELNREDLAARWRATLLHTDASQHFLSLPHIRIDGERAVCEVHARVEVRLANTGGSHSGVTHGTYTFGLTRSEAASGPSASTSSGSGSGSGSGWRIDSVTMGLLWNDGNPRIMELAAEKGAQG
ncbi:nuclear transport factor 2 family protein [Streptomyces sp. NPDC056716]|uniref:nuclear transport factor 2 family protein n=1 Tax=unclassified Streptomyces TaxID=2593676 RepID=UPI00368C6B79